MTQKISDVANEAPRERQASAPIYTVDSFADGISFGKHTVNSRMDLTDAFQLGFDGMEDYPRLRSRYALDQRDPFVELERQMMRLSRQGTLSRATIVFGTSTDPFLPFECRFDASMKFLQLFQRYTPGKLIVQTRSPLVVIAMPVLRRLGKHTSVTIGLETQDEESVRRYTPGMPKATERLKAAQSLRHFGIAVTLQAAPLLPYGDWKRDAGAFAEILIAQADRIRIQPLTDGRFETERRVRHSELARKLAEDRKFHWLRPDTATPLITEIERRAPEKLKLEQLPHLVNRQISIFAA